MKPREAQDRRGGFVGAGIVLHRAGAEGVEVRVNAPVFAGEVGVVTDHGRLVHLRQPWLLFAPGLLRQHLLQPYLLYVGPGEGVASAALATFVSYQVTQHSEPPPRRRRALFSSASRSQRRASPRRRDPGRLPLRSPKAPRSPEPRPVTPQRTPTKTVPPESGVRSRSRLASQPGSALGRWRAPSPDAELA